MKKIMQLSTYAILSLVLFLSSCDKDEKDELDEGAALQELSADESSFQQESDNLLNDINKVMENSPFGKAYTIKGATVNDSSFFSMKKVVITFNGDNEDGTRHRKGTITMQLIAGDKWSDQDALIKIQYTKLVVTRNTKSKTIEFGGIFYLRNVSGGKVFASAEVTHKYWGAGYMNFDGSAASREWSINRRRVFTNIGGVLGVTTDGDTTINGNNHVMIWGKTRKGIAFTTSVVEPVVFSSTCLAGHLSGQKTHKGMEKDIKVTYGVDDKGVVVTSGCPYGLKVEWTNKKEEGRSAILAY